MLFAAENLTQMPTLPVYMAAPWYNYWPYDGHFQTVAPIAHRRPSIRRQPTRATRSSGRIAGYVPNNPVPEFPMGKK